MNLEVTGTTRINVNANVETTVVRQVIVKPHIDNKGFFPPVICFGAKTTVVTRAEFFFTLPEQFAYEAMLCFDICDHDSLSLCGWRNDSMTVC